MKSRIVTWKDIDIYIGPDGRASTFGRTGRLDKTEYPNLREAFKAINEVALAPESLWDTIKDAVRYFKGKRRVYESTYLGDDDRGIDNECRLDLYYDGVYDFLKDHHCLHLVYPNYYRRGLKEELELSA